MESKFVLSMTAAVERQQKQYSTLIRFDDFDARPRAWMRKVTAMALGAAQQRNP
jgi:hypothetical protein